MNTSMHLIATTDEKGLHVGPEQIERAGISPAVERVEIRPYTEEDWVADGERTFASGDEFLAYLGACLSHAEQWVCRHTAPDGQFRRAFAKLDGHTAAACMAAGFYDFWRS